MAPVVLSKFSLAIDIDSFIEYFWLNTLWYEEFLVDQLKDLNVSVGEWSGNTDVSTKGTLTRTIRSYHPSKISFPGLPSHAESWKVQTLDTVKDQSGAIIKVHIRESNSFRGIPYADYFNVNTEWTVLPSTPQNSSPTLSTGGVTVGCAAVVHLDFEFLKSTWLQGTIESNTKAELIEVYELWLQSAQLTIRRNIDRRPLSSASPSTANMKTPTEVSVDLEAGGGVGGDAGSVGASTLRSYSAGESDGDESCAPRIESGASTPSRGLRKNRSYDGPRSDSDYQSDEEMQFFDCEDDGSALVRSGRSRMNSFGNTSSGDIAGNGRGISKRASSLSEDLLRFYPQSRSGTDIDLEAAAVVAGVSTTLSDRGRNKQQLHNKSSNNNNSNDSCVGIAGGSGGAGYASSERLDEMTSTRDIAVTIVEAIFVLAEFSYWRVHQLYVYDLKEVFDIDPGMVGSRFRNTFMPFWHSPLLLTPDLYGPLISVLALPQCLLVSMEISRHGCNPTTQLGNALVVSLFIWFGLSALYRLLALLVAPSIEFKHCLCVTGYGFFAWNIALLCIYPLENFSDILGIPTMLPLVIFGIPSSLAQGAMFWEHTPASSMTLQPSQLPPSIQQFATTHNRCLQQILWALPKILAFLLVAGTHYQFLWYMARVFLPGRRQLCRLSALVQPSHYADILTQKELRNFAISLFGKG